MTFQKLVQFHEVTCDNARALLKGKNHDYASEEDALKNIKFAAEQSGITPVRGCFNRACDKFSRISNFVINGDLENESVQDSFEDFINYLVFTLVLINEENDENS